MSKRIYMILIMVFTFFMFYKVQDIYAGFEGIAITPISPSGCGAGNTHCYTNDIGFRLTIVNDDGDRCRYSQSTNKILCDSSAQFYKSGSTSYDYWWNDAGVNMFVGNCWQYGYKLTKKEFLGEHSNIRVGNFVGACTNYNTSGLVADMYLKDLFGVTSYKDIKTKNGSWKVVTDAGEVDVATASPTSIKIEAYKNPHNINNIIDYLECTVLTEDSKKFGEFDSAGNRVPLTASECEGVPKNNEIINRIFRKAFNNEYFDIANVRLVDAAHPGKGIYIQIEQVVSYNSHIGPTENHTFKGTVAEFSYLYLNNVYPGKARWGLIGNGELPGATNDIYDDNNNDTSALCSKVFDGWSADLTGIGTGFSTLISKNKLNDLTDGTDPLCASKKIISGKTPNLFERYGSEDTRNLVSFWVNPKINGDCNLDARSIISNASYLSDSNWKRTLFDEAESIRNECFGGSSTFNEDDFSYSRCYQLDPNYIKHIGVPSRYKSDGTIIDVCQPLDCESTLLYSNKVNLAAYNAQGVSTREYVTNITEENQLPTNYDKAIYYLYHNVSDFHRYGDLNYYNYRGMYNKPAECKITPTAYTIVEALCDSSPTVVFQDNSTNISSGIAYNNTGGTNGQTSYDSNFDVEEYKRQNVVDDMGNIVFDSSGNPTYEYAWVTNSGYCKETVSFTFPQSPSTVKAGKLMKWGINSSVENGVFGKMYVERNCYYPVEDKTNTSKYKFNNVINLSYVNNLKPDIKINYKEALPTDINRIDRNSNNIGYDIYDTTAVNLEFNQTNLSVTVDGITTDLDVDTDLFTCTNCITASNVKIKTDYDITYPDKLKWYFDKGYDGGNQLKDKDSIGGEADTNLRYSYIGYGLPTSFITPSNTYSIYDSIEYDSSYSYGYEVDTLSPRGALYLQIKNVGSTLVGGGNHFDKLLSYGFSDGSEGSGVSLSSSMREGYLVYSCGFSIKNDLFGSEDKSNCMLDDNCVSPEGMDVVFRTVQLIDDKLQLDLAFPGRSGFGRSASDRGYNWYQKIDGTILSDETIAQILSSSVYNYQPMYHIDLTPGKIRDIRSMNSEIRRENDPYSFMGELEDGTKLYEFDLYDSEADIDEDLSLIDIKDEYKYAKSNFITELTNSDYGLTGTCIIANRGEHFANTQGCHPWGMINAYNSD